MIDSKLPSEGTFALIDFLSSVEARAKLFTWSKGTLYECTTSGKVPQSIDIVTELSKGDNVVVVPRPVRYREFTAKEAMQYLSNCERPVKVSYTDDRDCNDPSTWDTGYLYAVMHNASYPFYINDDDDNTSGEEWFARIAIRENEA